VSEQLDVDTAIAKHNERAARHRKNFETAVGWMENSFEFQELVRLSPSSVIETIGDMIEMIMWYEDGITWQTTCTHCAQLMNDNYNQYEKIEQLRRLLAGYEVDKRRNRIQAPPQVVTRDQWDVIDDRPK
jgi:hypothetical protein